MQHLYVLIKDSRRNQPCTSHMARLTYVKNAPLSDSLSFDKPHHIIDSMKFFLKHLGERAARGEFRRSAFSRRCVAQNRL
jgi:hypothetical protein